MTGEASVADHLTAALHHLDTAVRLTTDPNDRADLETAARQIGQAINRHHRKETP